MTRRGRDGFVAAGLAAVCAIPMLANLHLDGDTLKLISRLGRVDGIGQALIYRGEATPLYLLEPPVIYLTTRLGCALWAGWNALDSVRLIALTGVLTMALMLMRMARDLGGRGPEPAFAAAAPFCWHGFMFIVTTCSHNVIADVLRVGCTMSLIKLVSNNFSTHNSVSLGIWMGFAVSWHLECVLMFVAVPLAIMFTIEAERRLLAFKRVCSAMFIGALIYGSFLCLAYGVSLGRSLPVEHLFSRSLINHQPGDPTWFFSSQRSLFEQMLVVAEGWRRMILGFPWLRPEGGLWTVGLAGVGLILAAVLFQIVSVARHDDRLKILFLILACHVAHSAFYESDNVKRWDMPAALSGLMGVTAIVSLRRRQLLSAANRARMLFISTGALLLVCNGFGYYRFATQAERTFLEAAPDRKNNTALSVDCVGAHYRLSRAARAFRPHLGTEDSIGGVLEWGIHDKMMQSTLGDWMVRYLEILRITPPDRPAGHSYLVGLVIPPAILRGGFKTIARDGFVYLLEDPGARE